MQILPPRFLPCEHRSPQATFFAQARVLFSARGLKVSVVVGEKDEWRGETEKVARIFSRVGDQPGDRPLRLKDLNHDDAWEAVMRNKGGLLLSKLMENV